MLTEERLPVYSRPLTEEENIANVRNLNEVVSDYLSSSFKLYSANLSQTVEHGAFNLFVFPKNFTILIDCGYTGQEGEIRAFLDAKGITKLNVVVVTHFDEDHSGCFDFIARNYCDGNTLFFRSMEYDWTKLSGESITTQQQEETYKNTLQDLGYANNSRIPMQNEVVTLNNGMIKLRFLNTDVNFAQSYYNAQSETNHNNYMKSTGNNFSLICEVNAFGKKVLMSGDIEQQAQKNNASFIEQCDIMQVPHHNWNHNGYYKFFDNAYPSIAFYNRNNELKDSFVYWSKYQRQCRGYVPTYYTFGQHVEIDVSKHGVNVISGYRDTTFNVNESQRQLVEYIPYYTNTEYNYWSYADWTIKDVLKMIKDVPQTISFALLKSSRYTKLLEELTQMTGIDADMHFMSNIRTFNVKRFFNWDGRVYHFGQYFDINDTSSYVTNFYESRTSFTNNSENTNMNLSVGDSKALDHGVRSPQKLVVKIKSTRDDGTSVYTIPIFQQVDSVARYLANDVNVSVDGENRYLRIIKCSLTILDQVVTLEECKLYVYNLSNNSLREYECTLESLKGES